MREIKIRVPRGDAGKVAELALNAAIAGVTSHEVYLHGMKVLNEEIRAKSSTSRIKSFLSMLVKAPFFDPNTYSFSSHDVRALDNEDSIFSTTDPVCIPFPEIQQNFWQYTHITASFVIRACVSAGLLGYAFLKDDMVLGIGAMIFTPFSPLILSVAFALATRDSDLMKQGVKAFSAAFVLTLLAAALVAKANGGSILFDRFGSLFPNIVIAAITGVMAAVADADDVGRRQLLGLALAYPFVKFPIWLGLSLVLGFPDAATTQNRLTALVANALIMTITAGVTFYAMKNSEKHSGSRPRKNEAPV